MLQNRNRLTTNIFFRSLGFSVSTIFSTYSRWKILRFSCLACCGSISVFSKNKKEKFSASLCHSSTSPHRFHIQFFRTYIFIIFSLRTRKKIINISTHTRGISAQKEKKVGEEARVCPKPRKISSLARFLTRRMEEKTCHVWLAE